MTDKIYSSYNILKICIICIPINKRTEKKDITLLIGIFKKLEIIFVFIR